MFFQTMAFYASFAPALQETMRVAFQQADFDFSGLALALAAISFGGVGVLLAGAFLFTEQAEKAKRTWLPLTIIGLVLVGVSGLILEALS